MRGNDVKKAMRALTRAAPDVYVTISIDARYFGDLDKTYEERFSIYTERKGWTEEYPTIQDALRASLAKEDRKENKNDTAP